MAFFLKGIDAFRLLGVRQDGYASRSHMEWGRPTGPHRSLCLPKPGDTGKSILIMKVHPSLGQRARGSCFAVTVYAEKSKLALSEALGLEPCLAPRAPIARGRNLRDHPLKAILSAGPEAGRIHW
jgi:hypothetical protein